MQFVGSGAAARDSGLDLAKIVDLAQASEGTRTAELALDAEFVRSSAELVRSSVEDRKEERSAHLEVLRMLAGAEPATPLRVLVPSTECGEGAREPTTMVTQGITTLDPVPGEDEFFQSGAGVVGSTSEILQSGIASQHEEQRAHHEVLKLLAGPVAGTPVAHATAVPAPTGLVPRMGGSLLRDIHDTGQVHGEPMCFEWCAPEAR